MTRMKWGNEGGSGSHVVRLGPKKRRWSKPKPAKPGIEQRRLSAPKPCDLCGILIPAGRMARVSSKSDVVWHDSCFRSRIKRAKRGGTNGKR